jgi:hypothetical protein
MYWVWNHSQSKGTGRHVMLACANWITGPDCTVRASTAELVQFSNAARSSVIKAVDALVKTGELELLEEARGTRSALYRIPSAVGYLRPERGSRGPKSGPLATSQRSGNDTASDSQGSENETPGQSARGPKTGPQGSENETPRGPKTRPHYQDQRNQDEEEPHLARVGDQPETDAVKIVQPLIDEMTRRGMRVSWQLQTRDWKTLAGLVQSRSVPVLVDHAERVWRSTKSTPYSARYFLSGWGGLPDIPGDAPPPLRAVSGGSRSELPTDYSTVEIIL